MREGAAVPLTILALGVFLAILVVFRYSSLLGGIIVSMLATIIAVSMDRSWEGKKKLRKRPELGTPKRRTKAKGGASVANSGISVCPTCHHDNPSPNNFCGNCRRPLRDGTVVYQ